jgi:hypothetical protein
MDIFENYEWQDYNVSGESFKESSAGPVQNLSNDRSIFMDIRMPTRHRSQGYGHSLCPKIWRTKLYRNDQRSLGTGRNPRLSTARLRICKDSAPARGQVFGFVAHGRFMSGPELTSLN